MGQTVSDLFSWRNYTTQYTEFLGGILLATLEARS